MNIRAKLPWVLSLALLSGGAHAQGGSTDLPPPAPPPPPAMGAGDIHHPDFDPDLEAQLAAAQKQLEQAAHEVAELSTRVNRPYIQHLSSWSFGSAIIGVQLDPAGGKGGARVTSVSPGGPAAEAGIRAGDLIVNVNDQEVTGRDAPHRLMKIIHEAKPDTKLVVHVLRDDSVHVFSVMPRQGPDDVVFSGRFAGGPALPAPPLFMLNGPLSNMELATLTPGLGKYFGTDKGVLVIRAPREGQLKLEDGDVILAIDGREPTSGSHATRILGSYQPGEKITMRIVRERKTLELQATI